MPQVIVNKTKWKEEIEDLELSSGLAKHALSQAELDAHPLALLFQTSFECDAPRLALPSVKKHCFIRFQETRNAPEKLR